MKKLKKPKKAKTIDTDTEIITRTPEPTSRATLLVSGKSVSSEEQTIKRSTAPERGASSARSSNSARVWSPQQEAIFQECRMGDGHIVVTARAGTGKTTTILEATKYLTGNVLLCAFNKRIAEELQHKLDMQPGPKVDVKTLHALGYRELNRFKRCEVNGDRADQIISETFARNNFAPAYDVRFATKRLVTMTKETFGADCHDMNVELFQATDVEYGITDLMPPAQREKVYELVPFIISRMKTVDGFCDFSDMLWLPLVNGLVKPQYDVVIVDEAQDMNAAQLQLAREVLHEDGRMIVVGDDRQAIYGFRGASSGSMDALKTELKAKELKLTTTYRCPRAVVAKAQTIVPEFEAHEANEEGSVRDTTIDQMLEEATPGDFVLSRANAPLMSVCLSLIRRGVRAKIEGKDIGKGLVSLLRKLKAEHVNEVKQLANEWAQNLAAKLDPIKDESRINGIYDQAEVLAVLAEEAGSLQAIEGNIGRLFEDTGMKGDQVVCSTVHKAKGLEAPRVYVLADTFFKPKPGAPPQRVLEEANLKYVAWTRAQRELVFVRSRKAMSDPGAKERA